MTATLEQRELATVPPPAPPAHAPDRWRRILAVVLALALAAAAAWTGARLAPDADALPGAGAGEGDPDPADALGGLPLTIVENLGQRDGDMRFYAESSRYGFAFYPDHVMVTLLESVDEVGAGPGLPLPQGMALALRFPGGDPDAVIEGHEPTGGHVNFMRGGDPDAWRTELPAYGGVVYRELWPGIDMVLRGESAQLKYEFHVQPGADPGRVALSYAGADGLALDADGSLVIATPLGELRDSPPVSWQEVGGERVPVDSRYALDGATSGEAHAYGFELGAYDPDHPLVIDPGLDFSTYVGGGQADTLSDIAVDSSGNVYLTGWTLSTDFPTTPGAFDRTHNGGNLDVFVSKLNADGTGLVYSTYLGGTSCPGANAFERGRAIAVDGAGHAYVTGVTTSPNFPTTSGAFQPTMLVHQPTSTCQAAFVTKLNPSGSGLAYSTFLGGTSQDDGRDLVIDGSGNAYVAGDTCSQNFPVTSGAFQTTRGAGCAAFLAKLNAAGSGLAYATYLGGGTQSSDTSIADAVAIDPAGNAYVYGATRALDFPSTPGSFQPSHPGGDFLDLFTTYAVKVNPSGSDLVYGTFLGGTKREAAVDMVVDDAGHAYVRGSTQSPEFPVTAGAYDTQFTGTSEGYLTKLEPDGSDLVFSTFLSGAPGGRLALAADGSIWLAGGTSGSAFTTPDAFSQQIAGMADVWFGTMSDDGSALLFGSYFGGVNNDRAGAIALDASGAVYIGGTTSSFDLPTTQGAFQSTRAGSEAAFVAKFGDGGGVVEPPPPPPTKTDSWSGRIRNETIRHFANVEDRGTIEIALNWDESRVNLRLRVVHVASGTVVFEDNGTDRPKEVSFHNDLTGLFGYDVINPNDRRTDYALTVTSPLPTTTMPPSLLSVTVDPSTVTGGQSTTGRVLLSTAARPGGEDVALSSSDPALAPVPDSVVVPAGATSATFTIPTGSVEANTSVTITASFFEATRTATLNVNAEDGITMSSLALDPTVVQGGGTSTGTATLTGPAPAGGAVVTLNSSNTAVATVPSSVTVPAGQTSTTFTVSALPQQFNQSSAISASHGGVTRTVILSVTAGSAPSLSSLTVDPAAVTGGQSSTGTVTLTAPAPLGGLAVSLSSSDSGVASVPASVTVPSGTTSTTFTVSTSSVSSTTSVTITAAVNGVTRQAALSVDAAAASPSLSSVSLSPTSVEGGDASTGTVTLSSAAPAGGVPVSLSSSDTGAATVPSSVTVAAGSTSASFTVSTSSVSSDTSSTITAALDGTTRTAVLSVTAPPPSTDTVTIERARYKSGELEVRAESSSSGATLSVYVTSTEEFIGTLDSRGRGKFSWPTNPQNITVRSSLGGSATRNVST